MPSTIVHLALAGLIAGTLLGEAFDRKSLLFIVVAIVFIDLDSFVDLFVPFGHRAVLHNLTIPVLALGILLFDVHVREESALLSRWGHWGYRVAWVSILCYAVAGVLLDMTDGVVNLFWPIHDQFYSLSGKIELSDQRGIVQTFVETSDGGSIPAPESRGTTEDVEITTGVAPGEPDAPDEEPERIFPVIGATWELIVFLTGTFVTGMRLSLSQKLDGE
jgi:inner membrane protein